jgi:hypothetical protein
VPEADIIGVGPTRGLGRKPSAEEGVSASALDQATPRNRLSRRHILLLVLAAYYVAWGLYEGIRRIPVHAIVVPAPIEGRAIT